MTAADTVACAELDSNVIPIYASEGRQRIVGAEPGGADREA